MPTPKFVGVETEFGIQVVGPTVVNPVLASSIVVGAYRGIGRRDVRWDHTDEHPLRDARGYEEPDIHELPEDELGLANTVLTNGARFYVDHAHPEYSTPECADARSLVVWDRAGERVLEEATKLAVHALPADHRMVIHKNNTDGKGAAYGTHENYLVPRDVPFGRLSRELIPYFVSRPIWAGAGRIGTEFDLDVPFQCSQRADFFEVEVGLETTLKRPIINTRDEPHADPDRFRRLHVINGDANLCEVATYLKVGVTMLVLDAVEDGLLTDGLPELEDPVRAFHQASHDLTGRRPLALYRGGTITPLELQGWFLERVLAHAAQRDLTPVEADVLARWERVLAIAENDPFKLRGQVDWATKHDLLDRYAARHGLDWDSDRLKAVDLQYHDVRRDKGLYHRLAARGEVERLVTDEEVEAAVSTPPEDTRAWFRGRVLEKFGEHVVAAGWDAIIIDSGRDALQRIPMMDPTRGTREHVEDLLARCDTPAQLLDGLAGR